MFASSSDNMLLATVVHTTVIFRYPTTQADK